MRQRSNLIPTLIERRHSHNALAESRAQVRRHPPARHETVETFFHPNHHRAGHGHITLVADRPVDPPLQSSDQHRLLAAPEQVELIDQERAPFGLGEQTSVP